jgi:hypothetical protein
LLCTALGLALTRASWKSLLPACLLLAAAAFAAETLVGQEFQRQAVIGSAASIAVTALAVHLRRELTMLPALLMSANAGFWCGAVGAVSSGPSTLLALPLVLVALPGRWIVRQDRAIVLKVLSGWLVAVAVLAAALPLVTTPGYEKDHRE